MLLDSPNGPVLSASRLGGAGGLWRWGGFVRQAEVKTAAEAIQALVRQLAAEPGSRTTISHVRHRGPLRPFAGSAVWHAHIRVIPG